MGNESSEVRIESPVVVYTNLETNIIKFKKLNPDAQKPLKAKDGDAAFDLVAIEDGKIVKDDNGNVQYVEYRTGIAIEPPKGYHTIIEARSSVSKYDLVLANGIGLIDNSYRGEIIFRYKIIPQIEVNEYFVFYKNGAVPLTELKLYKKGDRIGQIKIEKTIEMEFVEVEALSETDRGAGAFGSTGK